MEQWEYYVANIELKEIDDQYDWVSSVGRETIVGVSPLFKRFGLAGWELVALLPLRQTTLPGSPGITQVEILTAAFKRRLEASSDAAATQRTPAGTAATANTADERSAPAASAAEPEQGPTQQPPRP